MSEAAHTQLRNRRPQASRMTLGVLQFGPLKLQGVRVRFGRNEEIFGESEPAEYVYSVVSGTVRTMRFTSDGRRQILGFHMAGDVFGFDLAEGHSCSAEAVTPCELVLVRRATVEKAAREDTAAAGALLQFATHQLHEAQDHAIVLGRRGAGERVAAFLLQLSDRFAKRAELDLPMSRADIADYLALTIETVSRAFTQMERDHAIALPTSRRVVMRSRSALEELQAA